MLALSMPIAAQPGRSWDAPRSCRHRTGKRLAQVGRCGKKVLATSPDLCYTYLMNLIPFLTDLANLIDRSFPPTLSILTYRNIEVTTYEYDEIRYLDLCGELAFVHALPIL